jgi:hypothetical protein
LLRKRLEPDISTWANKARIKGAVLERGDNSGMSLKDWEELWDWAAPEANEIVRNVMMGLGDDESNADEEDEEDVDEEDQNDVENKMDVDPAQPSVRPPSGPAMPLDQLLGISVTGAMPQRRYTPGMRMV